MLCWRRIIRMPEGDLKTASPDTLLGWSRMKPLDPGQVRKILVRSTNWIGDAVMTTPALGAVRAAFPSSEIVLAANPAVAELMSPHPFCDRVIVYEKRVLTGGSGGFGSFAGSFQRSDSIWPSFFRTPSKPR